MSELNLEALTEQISIRPVRSIVIGERVRQEGGDIDVLALSLETNGQIQPIVLDGDKLIAGFRRLTACVVLEARGASIKHLPIGHIKTLQMADLDPLSALLLEFEENKRRKAFSDAEEAIAIAKIAAAIEKHEGPMRNKELATRLGYSTGQISMAMTVAEAVTKKGRKELLKEGSIAGAHRKLKTIEKLEAANARAKKEVNLGDTVKGLHIGDGVEWLQALEPESIDFFNFDPPWGIDVDSHDRNQLYGTFDDSKEVGLDLASRMIPELYRALKDDTFSVVWFGIQFYEFIRNELIKAGFKVPPNPHIWFKTDKAGSQSDPTKHEANAYEAFFVVRKGDPRIITTGRPNVLSYPMPSERIHYAQKNTDLLVDLLERYTMGNMVIADPTFGSGAIFVAGSRLGRTFAGCELDPQNHANAIAWLKRSKLK